MLMAAARTAERSLMPSCRTTSCDSSPTQHCRSSACWVRLRLQHAVSAYRSGTATSQSEHLAARPSPGSTIFWRRDGAIAKASSLPLLWVNAGYGCHIVSSRVSWRAVQGDGLQMPGWHQLTDSHTC